MEQEDGNVSPNAEPILKPLRFNMKLEEDVGAAIEDLIMYSRLGLVDDALAVINEVLWRHLLFFPALAETVLFLLEHDQMRQLNSILILLGQRSSNYRETFDNDEIAFVDLLYLALPTTHSNSPRRPIDLMEGRKRRLLWVFRDFHSEETTPTKVQIAQIYVTIASIIAPSWAIFIGPATRYFYLMVDNKLLWESTYIFRQICTRLSRFEKNNIASPIASVRNMYQSTMLLTDASHLVTITNVDQAEDYVPELICSMVAKVSLCQVLRVAHDHDTKKSDAALYDREISSLQATAKRQLGLLLRFVPGSSSRSTYAEFLGFVTNDLEHSSQNLSDPPPKTAEESAAEAVEAYMQKPGSFPVDDLTAENLKNLKIVATRQVSDQRSSLSDISLSMDAVRLTTRTSVSTKFAGSSLSSDDRLQDTYDSAQQIEKKSQKPAGLYSGLEEQSFHSLTSNEVRGISSKRAVLSSDTQSRIQPFEYDMPRSFGDSIRLFHIRGGLQWEHIDLRLGQFPVDRHPPYRAISYTWGDPHHTVPVLVNGKIFNVCTNLWQILNTLRDSDADSFLWVDALCINQANLAEHSYLVRATRSIYTNADSVIIWLGSKSSDSTEFFALDFINDLAEFCQGEPKPKSADFWSRWLSSAQLPMWEEFWQIANLDLWNRTWIIQEVFFSCNAELRSGNKRLMWRQFEEFIDYVLRDKSNKDHPTLSRLLQSRMTRLVLQRRTGREDLYELLRKYYNTECTDRRDKVYGLLGLAWDCLDDMETSATPQIDSQFVNPSLLGLTEAEAILNKQARLAKDLGAAVGGQSSLLLNESTKPPTKKLEKPRIRSGQPGINLQPSGFMPDYTKGPIIVFLDTLRFVKASIPSSALIPATMLVILRALQIDTHQIRQYNLIDPALLLHLNRTLSVTPLYVSTVSKVVDWEDLGDLTRVLNTHNWTSYIGVGGTEILSDAERHWIRERTPRTERRDKNSVFRGTAERERRFAYFHANTDPRFHIQDRIRNSVNAAMACGVLNDYPLSHELKIDSNKLSGNLKDKRTSKAKRPRQPRLVLEQNPKNGRPRMGFACTSTQKGDLVIQFKGLDTTLIVRRNWDGIRLVGKAMMLENFLVEYEESLDPICEGNRWASGCWCVHNPDGLELEMDPLSFADILLQS